jgi:hypothetical protein
MVGKGEQEGFTTEEARGRFPPRSALEFLAILQRTHCCKLSIGLSEIIHVI